MGGIFSKPKAPRQDPSIAAAQKKQEERLSNKSQSRKHK